MPEFKSENLRHTPLNNLLPDYEYLRKQIARHRIVLKQLEKLYQEQPTDPANARIWSSSQRYEYKSKRYVTEQRLAWLERQWNLLQVQMGVDAKSFSQACLWYEDDKNELLAELDEELTKLEQAFGNGDQNQLEAILQRKAVYPLVTEDAPTFLPYDQMDDETQVSVSCALPIDSQSTRIRLVYEDDPQQPVRFGSALYWLYDALDPEHIEQGTQASYNHLQVMLPIGVGITDANGFLMQSVPFPEDQGLCQIDYERHRLLVKPQLSYQQKMAVLTGRGRFRQEIAGLLESPGNSAAFHRFLRYYNTRFGGKSQEQDFLITQEPRRDSHTPELSVAEQVYANIFAKGQVRGQPSAADAALSKAGFQEFKARNLQRRISNQYFYSNRRYGFLLYPSDRGHFVTRDLETLPAPVDLESPAGEGETGFIDSMKSVGDGIMKAAGGLFDGAASLMGTSGGLLGQAGKISDAGSGMLGDSSKFQKATSKLGNLTDKFDKANDKFGNVQEKFGKVAEGYAKVTGSNPGQWSGGPVEPAAWADARLPKPSLEDGGYVTTIALHCTLPEWDRRLCRQLDRVLRVQRRCAAAVNGHVTSLAWISQMQGLANLYRTQCADLRSAGEREAIAKVAKALDDMEGSIVDWMDNPTDTEDFKLASLKQELESEAGKLWELLDNPALGRELQRYMQAASSQSTKTDDLPPPGPEMEVEPHWVNIFDTLGNCYAAFENTSYKAKAWDEHLQEGILWIANQEGQESLQLEEGAVKGEIDRLTKLYFDRTEDGNVLDPLLDRLGPDIDKEILDQVASSRAENETAWKMLVAGMDQYQSATNTLVHNTPGPASILMVVLDVYGDHVSKLIARNSQGRSSLHIKLFFRVMRKMRVIDKDTDFRQFKESIYLILRAHGRQYFPGGKKPRGGRNELSNTAQRVVFDAFWRRFPVKGANGKPSIDPRAGAASLSDQIYAGRNMFGYKIAMQLLFWMLQGEALGNLKKEWLESEDISLGYVAEVMDFCGQSYIKLASARILVSQMLAGKRFAGKVTMSSDAMAKHSERLDRIAQRLNVLSIALSIANTYDYIQQGYYVDSAKELTSLLGLAMSTYAHAVRKWTLSATGGVARQAGGWLARRGTLAVGGLLLVPVVGEAAMILGAVISAGLLIMDLIDIVVFWNRTPLDKQFATLLAEFGKHQFKTANQDKVSFEDFYRDQLPKGATYKQARAELHHWHQRSAISLSGVDWERFDERAVIGLRRLRYADGGVFELVDFQISKMYRGAPSLQKEMREQCLKDIDQAYATATHPGRETWQLPDGRTGVECAAQLERGEGTPNEFKALVVLLNKGFLQPPTEFYEGSD